MQPSGAYGQLDPAAAHGIDLGNLDGKRSRQPERHWTEQGTAR